MGIEKIGKNLWRVKVRIRHGGKIVPRSRTIQGSAEDAKAEVEILKAEIRGMEEPDCSLTSLNNFGEVLGLYLEKRQKTAPSDLQRCRMLKDALGEVDLKSFPDKFERFMKIYRIEPTKKTGNPPANATVNRVVEIVRASFNLAVELGFLETNPIGKARFPKLKETPRDMVLSDIDRQRLLNIVDRESPHLSAIVRFSLQVPCRKSELVNMKREQLDLLHNAIRVRNGTTKNDMGVWKPIPPDMVEYFRNIPAESEYLFYRKTASGYATLGDFKKSWKRCLKLAGIADFRFHDTRHMAATELLDNGTPAMVVQQVAGWKTDMLKHYYHRDGKKSLELVRFNRCESSVNLQQTKIS